MTFGPSLAKAGTQPDFTDTCDFLLVPHIENRSLEIAKTPRAEQLACLKSLRSVSLDLVEETLEFDELESIIEFLGSWEIADSAEPLGDGDGWATSGFGSELPQSRLGKLKSTPNWNLDDEPQMIFE